MKKLILTRHAKSSWDDLSMMDHERPLNKRGRKASQAIGEWLSRNDHLPEETLCSSAKRCQETWSFISQSCVLPPDPQIIKRMYLPAPETLYEILKRANADSVMMIAHNPGIAEFASLLLSEKPISEHFARYPTGATAIVTFDIGAWSTPFMGKGQLQDFVVPRQLTD